MLPELEFALRVIQSAALAIHALLDISDPLCGAKSSVLRIEDSLPRWFLPAVGVFRALAAVANLADTRGVLNLVRRGDGQGGLLSSGLLNWTDRMVLAAQAYIYCALDWGGVLPPPAESPPSSHTARWFLRADGDDRAVAEIRQLFAGPGGHSSVRSSRSRAGAAVCKAGGN